MSGTMAIRLTCNHFHYRNKKCLTVLSSHSLPSKILSCSLFSSSSSANTFKEKKDRVETIFDSSTGIAHVKLNRPDKLNALDLAMFEALESTVLNLRKEQSLRVVILSGKGRAFCTGLDIKSLMKPSNITTAHSTIKRLIDRTDEETDIANLCQNVCYLWRTLPVPVISVLHGMCYGGGIQIALGADFRYTTSNCKLSIMEGKWGLIPDMAASVTLRELISIDHAKELTMTAKIISGKEAEKIGLVTRCLEDDCGDDDDLERLLHYAEEDIAKKMLIPKSPDAIACTKALYQENWLSTSEEYSLKAETKLQRSLLATWNQVAATGRNFGWNLPYFNKKQ